MILIFILLFIIILFFTTLSGMFEFITQDKNIKFKKIFTFMSMPITDFNPLDYNVLNYKKITEEYSEENDLLYFGLVPRKFKKFVYLGKKLSDYKNMNVNSRYKFVLKFVILGVYNIFNPEIHDKLELNLENFKNDDDVTDMILDNNVYVYMDNDANIYIKRSDKKKYKDNDFSCLIDAFFEKQKKLRPEQRQSSCMIACSCRKCAPHM